MDVSWDRVSNGTTAHRPHSHKRADGRCRKFEVAVFSAADAGKSTSAPGHFARFLRCYVVAIAFADLRWDRTELRHQLRWCSIDPYTNVQLI